MSKIEKLQALLSSGEAAMIISAENQSYFLGFEASNGYLFVGKENSVYITDSRYITAAKEETAGIVDECVLQQRDFNVQLAQIFSRFSVKSILFEGTRVSAFRAAQFEKKFGGKYQLDFSDKLDNLLLMKLRRCKDSSELDKILRAQSVTQAAFEHIIGFIRPGVSELEIARELDYYMLTHGADALSFETIVVSGENTAKPHGVPSGRRVKGGEFVTMDFGAAVDFYHSDMTRTICVGEPSDEMVRVYNVVLLAQSAAFSAAADGVPCREVDKAARDVITEAGYGEYFGHATGHGVGVEIHEQPCFSPSSKDICRAGDVITDEPGIYIPGKFGVRIEDMLYIGEDSVKNLTDSEKKLICI